jgi:sodium/potassium/calcium exchanger 6
MPQLIIGGFLLIFIIFRYTGIVVDDYIAPGIEWLNKKFGFSEALGGVTLLAFANGAGDVITALVAGGSAGGVSYNVGS